MTVGRARRRYDSPVRRQGMEETRGRIVAAGVELVRELKTWDWTDLTFRAVADHAGVGERTVYRHFPTEKLLHAAVMAGLAREAGVDYEQVTLATVAETAARVFGSMRSMRTRPEPGLIRDDALEEADRQRREALLRAVAAERPDWSERQRTTLAASLDLLWSVPAYDRLVEQWSLDPEEAMAVITSAIATMVASAGADEVDHRA